MKGTGIGMKKIKFKSLAIKIWAIFTLVILVIICSISGLYVVAYRHLNENAKINDLKVAHNILLQSDDLEDSKDLFDELKNLKGSNHYILKLNIEDVERIVNKKRLIYLMPRTYGVEKWISGHIEDDNMSEKLFKESYQRKSYIFIISSIESNDLERSYLISYMPNYQDNTFLYTVLIISILFIGIGFLAAKLVANHISQPLKELEKYTARIALKDWKNPIAVESEDEIGRLAKSMISMQRELQRADEKEKMYLQSISHELKTPVAIIMSHAQGIIDGIYIESAENTAEIIKEEAIRLEKNIKQLLYLNTLNYALENNNDRTDIHLDRLLQAIINRFEAINTNLHWDLNIDAVSMKGSEDKIQVAIENILDNALRYARNKISLSLKIEEGSILIEIYNDGPNINDANIDRIFDNLYKDKTGNFGLGLTISKKIVEFYNGKIYAANKECGVSFFIKFPFI